MNFDPLAKPLGSPELNFGMVAKEKLCGVQQRHSPLELLAVLDGHPCEDLKGLKGYARSKMSEDDERP